MNFYWYHNDMTLCPMNYALCCNLRIIREWIIFSCSICVECKSQVTNLNTFVGRNAEYSVFFLSDEEEEDGSTVSPQHGSGLPVWQQGGGSRIKLYRSHLTSSLRNYIHHQVLMTYTLFSTWNITIYYNRSSNIYILQFTLKKNIL